MRCAQQVNTLADVVPTLHRLVRFLFIPTWRILRMSRCERGYTAVELMVTIAIVTLLAVTGVSSFVKLLSIQERDREEAYIREKLSDICGAYADFLSVGSSISSTTGISNQQTVVKYRWETGGVSLETGIVTRVAYLLASLNSTNRTVSLDVYGYESGQIGQKLSRRVNGNATLIPQMADLVSCTITPLNGNISYEEGLQTSDAALGYLRVKARYEIENDEGEIEEKFATAERVVRLWNQE